MDLLASGEPEEIEHLSDEELDGRTSAQRRPLPQRLRTRAPLAAALMVGVVLGGVGMSAWRDREQRVQAASTATLDLTFQHAEPTIEAADPGSGNRAFVHVHLDLENRSPGPVRVESLRAQLSSGVERADVRAWRPRDLAPGETTRVNVDVTPECGPDRDRSLPELRLAVAPERGGVRDVQVRLADTPLRYTQAAMTACEWLNPADTDAELSMAVGSAELKQGRGRTADLVLQMLVLGVDGHALTAGGSVTGAELTLPGVRVVQPTVPVPIAGADRTALVFALTVDSCAVALGGGRVELRVTATVGARVVTLEEYTDNRDLELDVLRYVVDVCR